WLPSPQPTPAGGPSTSYAEAVARATPSVVNIYTAKVIRTQPNPMLEDFLTRLRLPPQAPRERIERSLGSGVIMTDEGHILTNNHVIEGADAIQVMLQDGRTANAMVIASDPGTDLAVLKTDLTDLQPVALGNSDLARVGDVVLAIGNPLGFGHSVTQGIVSALGRYGLQQNTYEDYIQTDATIHLGNSGGALVNANGELLGINTLVFTGDRRAVRTIGTGISLAIPVNLAVFVMDDLIEYGQVVRGWVGISVDPIKYTNPRGEPRLALRVTAVAPDSPAQRAGVRVGDVITHINNEPVLDLRLAIYRITLIKPGDVVELAATRDGESIVFSATVEALEPVNSLPIEEG
ncbi:MAG: S1C family serine protease, partial [Halioglobus sp.]